MKKIIIILIILVCLFSFMELFCFANERPNYKNIWDGWSDYEKYVYLWGLSDGLCEDIWSYYSLLINPDRSFNMFTRIKKLGKPSVMRKIKEECSEKLKKEIDEIEKMEDDLELEAKLIILNFGISSEIRKVIRDVTTDLYKDPANSYICITDMCYLAFWKIKGKDINPILIKLREEASD